MSNDPIVWLAALTTISIISFVFKPDNIAFRVAQSAFLGVAAGNAIVVGVDRFRSQAISPLASGQLLYIVPILLSVMLFARFMRGYQWMSRYPMSVLIASGAGIGLAGAVEAQLLRQVSATFVKLNTVDNIILFLGVLGVLAYFFLTQDFAKHLTGPGNFVIKFGRGMMMIGFGATFGSAVMGRSTLLIARIQYLLSNWLGII